MSHKIRRSGRKDPKVAKQVLAPGDSELVTPHGAQIRVGRTRSRKRQETLFRQPLCRNDSQEFPYLFNHKILPKVAVVDNLGSESTRDAL